MGNVRKTNGIGEIGRHVAVNVRRLRNAQGISTTKLATLLDERGRLIHATSITKLEGFDRAVDVDDLVALALVLGVDPAELLTPFQCRVCDGKPPTGFSCRTCGEEG